MTRPKKSDSLEAIIDRARSSAEAGDVDGAWREMSRHRDLLTQEPLFAWAWLVLQGRFGQAPDRRETLELLLRTWPRFPPVLDGAANALLAEVDGRAADEPVPDDDPSWPAMVGVANAITSLSETDLHDPEIGGSLFNTLGNALRLAGPEAGELAPRAYERAIALHPRNTSWRFDLGLFYKGRRRFEAALECFRHAAEGAGNDEATQWNIAICATGAGRASEAMAAWNALGFGATMGPDGRPFVGDLGDVKVRLAAGGDFEHVWARPRSPCHGEVMNATLFDGEADAGDVVLWDGQPIGYVEVEGHRVPRFASLGLLERGSLRTYRFLAEQPDPETIGQVDRDLPDFATLYVFEAAVRHLCSACIRGEGPHDLHRDEAPELGERVHGKLVVPRDVDLRAVAQRLEQDARGRGVRLAVPSLLSAAGDELGAQRHRRLWAELEA
ncbi:MAG: hypothetical protein IT384_20950 [Deltaproteobacteria bacterium]|nr:hypothetical protein [Deltaproteobacteria bacterium]